MQMKHTIICPLCEDSALLATTLASLFQLDGQDYEVIFAADDNAGAAIAVAETVRQQSSVPSRIIVNSLVYCHNPKLNNLYKAWHLAQGEWIMLVDCNMLLPSDAWQRLESRWQATTGMVCSPPVGSQPDNWWAEVECAFLNTFEAKWQVLADRLGYGFCQGKVMFCHKTQFEHLGGLIALDAESCEDAAATKLVRHGGLRVRLVARLFEQPLGHRAFRTVWDRQVRWAKLRRNTFPVWYSLEIAAATSLPMLLALAFAHRPLITLLIVGLSYSSELVLAKCAGWHLSWRTPFAMLTRDLLMIGIWLTGWRGRSIRWSGHELQLDKT
jgi:ceramide glucosyltransferase